MKEDPRPGYHYRLFYSNGNRNNTSLHIVAIVDEEWLLVREWSGRRGWRYRCMHSGLFELQTRDGHLKRVGRSRELSTVVTMETYGGLISKPPSQEGPTDG